jgi:peroxiredoxin
MTRGVRIAAVIAIAAAGHARAASAQTAASLAVPRPVQFVTRTIAGDSVRVGAHEPATLVAVFATWCRSCKDEVAIINALRGELSAHGARVLAINVDKPSAESVRRWLDANGGKYPVALDTSAAIAHALGVVGVPEFYLISGEGRAVFSRRGPVESVLPALRAMIAGLPRAD